MAQTLFPLLQDPDEPTPEPGLTDQNILDALLMYEQGNHISKIQQTLFLNKTQLRWIKNVTQNIVSFMDNLMSVPYANQPDQVELLDLIDAQSFGFSRAVNQQIGIYRRNHATTLEWRTMNNIPDTWDAYKEVTRID